MRETSSTWLLFVDIHYSCEGLWENISAPSRLAWPGAGGGGAAAASSLRTWSLGSSKPCLCLSVSWGMFYLIFQNRSTWPRLYPSATESSAGRGLSKRFGPEPDSMLTKMWRYGPLPHPLVSIKQHGPNEII